MPINGDVPLQRVALRRGLGSVRGVECGESQVEPLTSASRPSLIQVAGRASRRGKYKPHLALISAPPSVLPTGTLIRDQNRSGRVFKRAGDIVFSLTVLLVGSPVLLLLAGLVKFSSPGPVFYVQRRVGRNYQRFGCIKFRTMRADADAVLARVLRQIPRCVLSSSATSLKRDRITPLGRFCGARVLMNCRSS